MLIKFVSSLTQNVVLFNIIWSQVGYNDFLVYAPEKLLEMYVNENEKLRSCLFCEVT